jgi:hypothetical protein
MKKLSKMLHGKRWRTPQIKELARELLEEPYRQAIIRSVMEALFDQDQVLRETAANLARWMTEKEPELLASYADELIGLLASIPLEEKWGRCYLGLIASKSACDQRQRLRVAELMRRLWEDDQNVVRCTAIDGFSRVALAEPSLREEATTMLEQARRHGTPAMRARASLMSKLLRRAQKQVREETFL